MFETINLKAFGQALKQVRLSLGYTQQDVRSNTGISCDTLRRIENGLVIPRYETLEYLSYFYKVDLLPILMKHRKLSHINNYYQKLDSLIIDYQLHQLCDLEDDFNNYVLNSFPQTELINTSGIEQFKLILKGIHYLNSEYRFNNAQSLDTFVQSMKVTIPQFNISLHKQFKYNFLELRILLLISIALLQIKDYPKSNSILEFLLDNLISFESNNDPVKKKWSSKYMPT